MASGFRLLTVLSVCIVSLPGFGHANTLYDILPATLKAAVDAAGLDGVLSDPDSGPYTAFAPDDAAFTALNTAVGYDIVTQLTYAYNTDLLTKVLRHHVLSKPFKAAEIDGKRKTLNKDKVLVSVPAVTSSSGNSVSVVAADVMTSNGIGHVIDGVLLPKNLNLPEYPTIYETLQNKGEFSILLSLIDSVPDLKLAASSPSTDGLTLFAPNDKALTALLNSLSDADKANLNVAEILKYHIVGEALSRQDVRREYRKKPLPMLNGEDIKIKGCSKIKTVSGQKLNVIAHERRALNGYIHVINDVMLPTNPFNP